MLPATSGIRGGGSAVPVVLQPGVQDPGASALEQSLGALPTALQQQGAILQQTEELRAYRAKAFDTINGQTTSVQVRIPLQTLDAQLHQADYQTHPEELDKQGHALIAEHGQTLSPGARAIYTKEAEEYLAVLHGRAEGERGKRTQEAMAYTTSQKLYQAQDDYAKAGNDYEREVALGSLQTFAQQGVDAGFFGGTQAATLVHKTVENAVKDRALALTMNDPVGAFLDLKGITEGKPAEHAALQNVPFAMVNDLMKDAQHQMQQQMTQKEHQERLTQAQLHQRQNATAIQLRTELMNIVPTPNNMAAIQLAKRHILEAGPSGAVSEPLHATLSNLAVSWEEKARTYTPSDDEPTKKRLQDFLTFATKPEEFDQVLSDLYKATPLLTGDTLQKMGQQIEARRGSLHPLNQEEAKAGYKLIMDTIAPGILQFGAMGMNYMEVEEKTRAANALRTYQERIMSMTAAEVRTDGMKTAREVLNQFYEVPLGMPDPVLKQSKFLPLPLRRGGPDGGIVPTHDMAVEVYRRNKVPPEQAGHDLRLYDAWRASPEGQQFLQQYYPSFIVPEEEQEAVMTPNWKSGPSVVAPTSRPTPGAASAPATGKPVKGLPQN